MNSGIYPIYKSKGPTSHDIIDKLRRVCGIKKIGHAGTLDPLASGVLVVGIGREATKKLGGIVKKEKEYIADIKLGEASTTFDAEGIKIKIKLKKKPTLFEVEKTAREFIGKIEQTPPQYSAIKIHGRPAYKYARAGKLVKIRPRRVEIRKLIVLKYKWPILKIKIACGPGVYIRTLANDLGEKLGVGGYLYFLERTKVGDFKKEDSITIEKFKKIWQDKD
jgi:tRNA pseudouridine55 synthase